MVHNQQLLLMSYLPFQDSTFLEVLGWKIDEYFPKQHIHTLDNPTLQDFFFKEEIYMLVFKVNVIGTLHPVPMTRKCICETRAEFIEQSKKEPRK